MTTSHLKAVPASAPSTMGSNASSASRGLLNQAVCERDGHPSPWDCIFDDQAWPDDRSAVVCQAADNFWGRFMELIEGALTAGCPGTMQEGTLREFQTERGGIAVAMDSGRHFFAARRWMLDYAGVDTPFAWTEIEVFLCPTGAGKCVLGYRMRSLGDPGPVACAWREQWELLLNDLPNAEVCTTFPAWEEAPSFLQMLSTWSASGEIKIDHAALSTAKLRLFSMQHDLDYQTKALNEQLALNTELEKELHLLRATHKAMTLQWNAASPDDVPETGQELSGGVNRLDANLAAPDVWEDLSGLEDWAKQNEDLIVIMPRAFNAAKKSDYEFPDQVRLALEYLAGAYRDSRMGLIGKAEADRLLNDSGVKLAGSAGASVAGSQGEAYFISWRGRRRFLDMHLAKGGGRITRYCLRVYFTWCEETERAIVGWLPTHLNNSLS